MLPCRADVTAVRGGGWDVRARGQCVHVLTPSAVLPAVYRCCGCEACGLPCPARVGSVLENITAVRAANERRTHELKRAAVLTALENPDYVKDAFALAVSRGLADTAMLL